MTKDLIVVLIHLAFMLAKLFRRIMLEIMVAHILMEF